MMAMPTSVKVALLDIGKTEAQPFAKSLLLTLSLYVCHTLPVHATSLSATIVKYIQVWSLILTFFCIDRGHCLSHLFRQRRSGKNFWQTCSSCLVTPAVVLHVCAHSPLLVSLAVALRHAADPVLGSRQR